jgi:hypothetical protein
MEFGKWIEWTFLQIPESSGLYDLNHSKPTSKWIIRKEVILYLLGFQDRIESVVV